MRERWMISDRVIEAAAKVLLEERYGQGEWSKFDDSFKNLYRNEARAVLVAAFEADNENNESGEQLRVGGDVG